MEEKNISMNKIIVETITLSPENSKMKNDKLVRQTFTCCNKKLEKFLYEGFDWMNGNIIASELTNEFRYCPYCGKQLDSVEE